MAMIVEDVLRTLKHQLDGAIVLDGRPLPVTIDYPDPDWVAENRPCLGILWYDIERDASRETTGVTITKDEAAGTATVEPDPQRWQMFLQFDLFSASTLDDARGFSLLLARLESLAASELVTEALGERIRLVYQGLFRDSQGRDYHSGVRYAVSVPLRLDALRQTYPLVRQTILRLYEGADLSVLDKELEV